MSAAKRATDLMVKITYQLRPPSRTTMAPCKRCARPSPGGQFCAGCLTDELGSLISNKGAALRWLETMQRAAQDEHTVMRYARERDASGT